MRVDPITNRLMADPTQTTGKGTLTCPGPGGRGREEVTDYLGGGTDRFFTVAGKAFEMGDHGFGWLYQKNRIDPTVSDRRY